MIIKYSNGEISGVVDKTKENSDNFQKLIDDQENSSDDLKKESSNKSTDNPFWINK